MVGDKARRACSNCGYIYFTDPKVGVGVLILADNRIFADNQDKVGLPFLPYMDMLAPQPVKYALTSLAGEHTTSVPHEPIEHRFRRRLGERVGTDPG